MALRYKPKKHFHYEFPVTSSYCTRELQFMFQHYVKIFRWIGSKFFYITGLFSAYNILAWHCLFWAKFWLSLGLIRLKLKIYIYFDPKMARPCVISRLLSHYASKSVKESDFYACLRKKINKNNHKTLYFTYLPRRPSWMDCHHIWHMGWSRGPNQLYQFLAIDSRVSNFCIGQNSTLPIDFAVNTVLLNRAECDQSCQFLALC